MFTLIADSGATKAEWCLLSKGKRKTVFTQGISPYFLGKEQIASLLRDELVKSLNTQSIDDIHYYGTGCANPENVKTIRSAIKMVFPQSSIEVNTDLMAAARALCGKE